MIPVLIAFTRGLREAWQQRKMMALLYLINLVVAYLLALPVIMLLGDALDHSVAADKLLQTFDVKIFQTIFLDIGLNVNLSRLLLTFAIFYMLLNTFFVGGILKIFCHGKRFTLRLFFVGCSEYFTRFIRLFLLSLVFIAIVVSLFSLLSILIAYFTQTAGTEFWPYLLLDLRLSIVVVLLAMNIMVFDYAKIITVVNNLHGMIDALQKAFLFAMLNLRKTTTLYFLFCLSALVFWAIYLLFESLLFVSNLTGIIMFILISQIYMISRIWLRLSFFAGQNIFFRHSNSAFLFFDRCQKNL